jgi:hypothetical protein
VGGLTGCSNYCKSATISGMAYVHARVNDGLLEAARSALELPEGTSGPQIVRASLATSADWPAAAVQLVARPRGSGTGTEDHDE